MMLLLRLIETADWYPAMQWVLLPFRLLEEWRRLALETLSRSERSAGYV